MASDPFPFPIEIYPDDWFCELSLDDFFQESDRAIEVDLGCGDGDFLIAMAQSYPERNFLGVERLLGRCRKVWKKSERAELNNVRVLRIDSNYALHWLIPSNSVSRLHFLFPDPWPKKKHAPRRQMCQPGFLKAAHRVLIDSGGEMLFKTDSAEYFEEAEETLRGDREFVRIEWEDSDFFYPKTGFERQWLEEGREIHRIRLATP